MDYMPFNPDALANWAEAEERSARLRAERAHAMTPPQSPYYSSDSDYTVLSFPPPENFQPPNTNLDYEPTTHASVVTRRGSRTSDDALAVSSAPMRAKKRVTCKGRHHPTIVASGR